MLSRYPSFSRRMSFVRHVLVSHRAIVTQASLALLCAILLAGSVSAAPYWGEAEVAAFLERGGNGPEVLQPTAPPLLRDINTHVPYAAQYARIASFLRTWQVTAPGADFGGIREGEHLQTIIQTDNTSESIWIWTRYYELTGDNQYYQNILNSFSYSMSHRAYNEEGGSASTTGYYRVYNSAWAVLAELKFRDVYGDITYKAYGDSCAGYLRDHILDRFGNSFYDYVNPPVLSWAMGALYYAGQHESRSDWINAAVVKSRDRIKFWVDGEPGLLGNQTWAMSGGATMWGLLNSYFLAVPDSTQPWLLRNKHFMDVSSDPGDFTNAWNGWYALGHRATGLALNDSYHLDIHVSLTNFLVDEDGDNDGGIPARPEDTDAMDQTWVSSYLGFMGLSDLLVGPSSGLVERTNELRLSTGPNPCSESARIQFELARGGNVSVTVHDLSGRRVASLMEGVRPAGPYSLAWSAERYPAGMYWVRVQTEGKSSAERIVHVR